MSSMALIDSSLSRRWKQFLAGPSCDVLLVSLVVARFLAYWVGALIHRPDDPLSVVAMYRYSETGYFTLIGAFLHNTFGDTTALETYEQGIRPTLVSVFPHGLFLRLFGFWGFAILDVLVPIAVYFLFKSLIQRLSGHVVVARLLAFIVCMRVGKIGSALVGEYFPEFWGHKVPRPFVTEIFFLGALVLMGRIAWVSTPGKPVPWKSWLGLSAALALLAQTQQYHAFSLLMPLGLLTLCVFIRYRGMERVKLVGALLLAGVVGIVCLWPMIAQRGMPMDEFERRILVVPFTLDRMPSPWLFYGEGDIVAIFAAVMTLVLGAWAFVAIRRHAGNEDRFGLHLMNATALLMAFSSFIAPWVTVAAFSKLFCVVHFYMAFLTISSASLLISASILLRLYRSSPSWRMPLWAGSFAVAGLAFALWGAHVGKHIVSIQTSPAVLVENSYEDRKVDFRSPFVALVKELEKPEYASAKVVATPDAQICSWWHVARKGFAYLPDATTTVLTDAQLEKRLLDQCQAMGMNEAQFRTWIRTPYNLLYSLLFERYVAYRLYQAFPLECYRPEDKAKFLSTERTLIDCFHFTLPQTEEDRLAAAFTARTGQPPKHPLDLLVIHTEEPFRPDPAHWEMKYENELFGLYQPMKDGTAARAASSTP